jgi:hypothetical protein
VPRNGIRRISVGLVDQASASLTTLCVSVAALRGSTAAATEFATVFVGYSLAVGLCRSITTEPAAPELPDASPVDVRTHVRASAVVGLAVGVGASLLAALFLRPATGLGLWALALPVAAVPVDSVRAAWIGARRPARAAPLSAVQLVAGVAGLTLTLVTGSDRWALGPLVVVSAALAVAALVWGPRVPLRRLRPRHWVYAGEWSLTYGLSQSSSLVLASLGLPLLPLLLRAQNVLFGPLFSLSQAVAALSVPELVSLRRRRSTLLPAAAGVTALLVGVSSAYALVVVLLPDRVLATVLGSAWSAYHPVVLGSAAAVAVAGATMGPLVAMRAHGAARTSLTCRVVMGVAGLLLPVGAALVWATPAYFWASAVAAVLGGAVCLLALRAVERRPAPLPVPQPEPTP